LISRNANGKKALLSRVEKNGFVFALLPDELWLQPEVLDIENEACKNGKHLFELEPVRKSASSSQAGQAGQAGQQNQNNTIAIGYNKP
jgi:hypothetical protein